MMRKIKKLPDRPFKMPQILALSHGTLSLPRQRILSRVSFILFSNIYIELLEKNRQKRPSLEETLQHPWFAEFKEIHASRTGNCKDANGLDNKFEAFTLTETNSDKMTADLRQL